MIKLHKHNKIFFLLSTFYVSCNANNEEIIIKAPKIEYYGKDNQQLSASGGVKLKTKTAELFTDQLIYNKTQNKIYAKNNIDLHLEKGYVIRAKTGEFDKDFYSGELTDFDLIFPDKSVMFSKTAQKINKDQYCLRQASYTSCKICPNSKPKWSIEAQKVYINQKTENITYHNLFLDIKGVPVFYTPYFNHPTPNAKPKSGILRPTIGTNNIMGFATALPLYYRPANNKDLTYTPIFTSKKGIIHNLEMRYLQKNSFHKFSGSFAIEKHNKKNRYNLDIKDNFIVNNYWQYGLNLKRTSDKTYIEEYKLGKYLTKHEIEKEKLLTSEVYLSYYQSHDFMNLKALSFQNLRNNKNIPGLPEHGLNATPVILPLFKSHLEKPISNSNVKLAWDSNFLSFKQHNIGNIHRFSSKLSAILPFITDGGHKFLISSSLRGDAFWYPSKNNQQNEQISRSIPQLELEWKYPMLMKNLTSQQLIVEPITQFIVSPSRNLNKNIINEDSSYMDLNDTNLFTDNAYSGLDLVEIGPRINYGLKSSLYNLKNQYIYLLIGQKYRYNTQDNLPTDHFSDYIGKITWNSSDNISLSYKFKLNRKNYFINYSEMELTKKFTSIWLRSQYLNYNSAFANKEKYKELFMEVGLDLLNNWRLSVSTRYNLAAKKSNNDKKLATAEARVTYIDDCFTVSASASRDYTVLNKPKNVNTYWFTIGLKNINN